MHGSGAPAGDSQDHELEESWRGTLIDDEELRNMPWPVSESCDLNTLSYVRLDHVICLQSRGRIILAASDIRRAIGVGRGSLVRRHDTRRSLCGLRARSYSVHARSCARRMYGW